MMTTLIPAISGVSDQTKARSVLYANGQLVQAPLQSVVSAGSYVATRTLLKALDTGNVKITYLTETGYEGVFIWTAGNFSSQITAADPRYIASSANPTGSLGAWIQSGSVETGHFYRASGARIHDLADRVFMGSATANSGEQVTNGGDWLTTFQLARGRSGGSIQEAQTAILTNSDPQSVNGLVVGSQTKNITIAGLNALGSMSVGINNNSTVSLSAYAGYNEAYRMSGAVGGAYGLELDTINYASAVTINPYAQNIGQSVTLQLASGGEYPSAGQFASSAAINIRNNNSAYLTGIIIGNDAISGTTGSSGEGEAIAMSTGHAINYYYGSGLISWQMRASTAGLNGNYSVTTNGTGAFAVPKLFAGSGNSTPTTAVTVSNNSAALPSALTGTVLHAGAVDGANARLLVDAFGTGVSSALSFRMARGTAAVPTATQTGDALVNVGGFGYGATGYSASARSGFLATATENWTDTAQGADFSIRTTLNGTTTLSNIVTVRNNGLVDLVGGSLGLNAPVTKTANFTLGAAENAIICNGTGTITATLPSASTFSGRIVRIKTIAAFTVVSASSNVVPLAGGAAGTAILAATAGKWADLQSDGTSWIIMAAN